MQNAVLEPLLAWLRIREVKPHIKLQCSLVDVGCGPTLRLLKAFPIGYFRSYVGIDPLAVIPPSRPEVEILHEGSEASTLKRSSFDVVSLLAVIEHVDEPDKVISNAYGWLKPGGILLITTPHQRSKRLLEFLSFKLGIASKREIHEHKRYYNEESLRSLLIAAGFVNVDISVFEGGLNLFAKAKK